MVCFTNKQVLCVALVAVTATFLVLSFRKGGISGDAYTISLLQSNDPIGSDANIYTPPPPSSSGMQRLARTQFIAALGDPSASSGIVPVDQKSGVSSWGLWPVDPGPRGVMLQDYQQEIVQRHNIAPSGWKFDPQNWWLEEHGLIMEPPDPFPLQEGKYLVTGGRTVTTTLIISQESNKDGTVTTKWKLEEGTLYDITHLPCRSARYQPIVAGGDDEDGPGSPGAANPKDFPVTPGAIMPSVPGTTQQDYAVIFVVGKAM
mmetsp:Transcript_8927/g.10432  ORF Transcript_8927/g.10432 Transcript_8927/m.10432 type:complete len:260 (+) Transcript_8927:93-872(+)|eukprot:CAMPEP_0170856394 /NCGR_PEP_ID=MMETSP0734-20130129/14568_1 /TAXON_ID=186038 /ORGANISM="Fragilariopsis kerguelensis, Strain L26-C5" /LENGTH=259 /DNA_ID=CAMNT_0011228227 /DNA_START=52 /DNA_END=834 /DNA_ORIENTATION=+